MTLATLLAGVIGSLATLLISEFLKNRSAAAHRKAEFGKSMFERRLQVAEAAASRLLDLMNALNEEIAYCELQAEDRAVPESYAKEQVELITSARKVLEMNESIYPFLLHFDVETRAIWPRELLREYHRRRGEIHRLVQARSRIEEALEHINDPEYEDALSSELDDAKDAYRLEYASYARVLRSMLNRTRSLMRLVKNRVRAEEARLSGASLQLIQGREGERTPGNRKETPASKQSAVTETVAR